MDIQKEIELFEEILLANPDFDEALLSKDENNNYEDSSIADQLGFFQAGIEVAEREDRMTVKAEAVPEGFVLVPRIPTEEMIQIGAKANSECLNDNAPLGERLYRYPAIQVYAAMVAGLEKSHD